MNECLLIGDMALEIKTLQELSLKNIKENFSRHTFTYAFSENEVLEKNLSFLQRRYSDYLFSELSKDEQLEEDHLYFLLNEFLRKIELFPLVRCSYKEKIVEKVIPIANSIDELLLISEVSKDCRDFYIWLDFLEKAKFIVRNLIPYMTNLKKLVLPHICDEYMLKLIESSCPNLIELDMKGYRYSELFRRVEHENNLINSRYLCKEIANYLTNSPALEVIKCFNFAAVLESLFECENRNILSEIGFLNLKFLDLTGCSAHSKALTMCSEICPKVKSLAVNISNSDQLELIYRFSDLENLFLNRNTNLQPWSRINVDNYLVHRRAKLKYLCILTFSLSLSTLIKSYPNLKTLKLINISYQELDKNSKESLDYLQSLQVSHQHLHNPYCTVSVLSVLKSCPNLQNLTFYSCYFKDSDFEAKFAEMSLKFNLKRLKFSFCDVSVRLIQHFISNCVSLEKLIVHYCSNINPNDMITVTETILPSNKTTNTNYIFFSAPIQTIISRISPPMYDLSDECIFRNIDKQPKATE